MCLLQVGWFPLRKVEMKVFIPSKCCRNWQGKDPGLLWLEADIPEKPRRPCPGRVESWCLRCQSADLGITLERSTDLKINRDEREAGPQRQPGLFPFLAVWKARTVCEADADASDELIHSIITRDWWEVRKPLKRLWTRILAVLTHQYWVCDQQRWDGAS